MGYRNDLFDNTQSNYGWYTCSHCGKKIRKDEAEADHIWPRSIGGDNNLNNLQVLCRTCNRQKKDNLDYNYLKGKWEPF